MKRRSFGLLAGSSVVAMQAGQAKAQSATPDASQLGTTLTPMGAEMAGNADGSIPAWIGGVTTLPAGLQPNEFVPDMFADEQPLVVIDSSNMASHAAQLSEGTQAMMSKYGLKIKVYPTHRTAAAPQSVYDRIKANVATAQLDPGGGRLGFSGAFGGVPFPIPDQANPLNGGAQVIWNHNSRWAAYAYHQHTQGWSVSSGRTSMAYSYHEFNRSPYYIAKSLDEYNGRYQGLLYQKGLPADGPPDLIGQDIIVWAYSDPLKNPQQTWELLNGQGRVRRAPEISFDTPSSQTNGIAGYDEDYGFNGSLERYDWKLLGKQEVYVPYNCNAIFASDPNVSLLEHFVDPELVRWEKHRCWVVEATLHPGERNVLARRKFYVDEDNWIVVLVDAWDANNNLFKASFVYNVLQPGLPGLLIGNTAVHNLQTGDYALFTGPWRKDPVIYLADIPSSVFDPANMAASAQY